MDFFDTKVTSENAKLLFKDFLIYKGMVIEDEYSNPRVTIYDERIPNSNALGNTSLSNKSINLVKPVSIVTFWHELAHFFSAWKDANGMEYSDYEYETNYDNHYVFDKNNMGELVVNRGIIGRFWSEAAAEYRATKMAWAFDKNSGEMDRKTKNRTYYDEEIHTMKTIADILDIDEDIIFFRSNKNNRVRKYVESRMGEYTGDSRNWTNLEKVLDFIEMEKHAKTSMVGTVQSGIRITGISRVSMKKFQENRKYLIEYLNRIIDMSYIKGKISNDEVKRKKDRVSSLSKIIVDRNVRVY